MEGGSFIHHVPEEIELNLLRRRVMVASYIMKVHTVYFSSIIYNLEITFTISLVLFP